jgi:hypothetical protein
MAIYYPQACVILNVRWEDFGTNTAILQKEQKIPVSCRSVRVERNDYSEADSFNATIDYNSFPFDPRCIRACGITVCMEDRKKVFNENNSLNIIEPSEANVVFQGFADESSISFDDTSRTIKLEGRDFTGLFVDAKRVNTNPIALSQPIDKIIGDLILEQEATKKIQIENRTGEVLPVLAKIADDFNPFTSVKNQKRGETYWDIIQSILGRVGLLGFIELDKFVISKPQNIYEKKNIKQFIYGANIKSLEFGRKLGRSKDFNVMIRSFSTGAKAVTEAKIPLEAKSPRFISNFGGTEVIIPQLDKDGKKIEPGKTADYLTFFAKDVVDKDALITIGESVYEELSRQQIEGKLTTFEMEVPEEMESGSSPVGFNQIRNGTAIRVYMDQSELKEIKSDAPKAQKEAFLLRRGYPRELAQAFAESLNRINTAFYTKSVSFELDQENGFTMELEFINFIDLDSSLLST